MEIAFQSAGSKGEYQKIISAIVVTVSPLTLYLGIAFSAFMKNPDYLFQFKNSVDLSF